MDKKDRAHVAIVHISIEVYDFEDETGKIRETSGRNLTPQEYKNFGVKPKQLIEIRGTNLNDCIHKLQQKIQHLKEK